MRLLSPASPPDPEKVAAGIRLLESWGLKVEVGAHAFDRNGHFLAGKDEDRLSDWNEALRDRGVRAIFTTRGGKGAYRIAHALDFAAARSDPKPCIGFSDATTTEVNRHEQNVSNRKTYSDNRNTDRSLRQPC